MTCPYCGHHADAHDENCHLVLKTQIARNHWQEGYRLGQAGFPLTNIINPTARLGWQAGDKALDAWWNGDR